MLIHTFFKFLSEFGLDYTPTTKIVHKCQTNQMVFDINEVVKINSFVFVIAMLSQYCLITKFEWELAVHR